MTLDAGALTLVELARSSARPAMNTIPVELARQQVRASQAAIGGVAPATVAAMDIHFDGPAGPITMRRYRPDTLQQGQSSAPTLLFLHGGGWVVGDLDSHDGLCRRLAQAGACQVFAVDYRLSPEHRFPAALEDAAAGLNHIVGHADELAVDVNRLGAVGDSAGGNLTAVLALMARDREIPALSLQVLLYPVCDLRMRHGSYARNGNGYLLTREAMAYFVAQYLPRPEDADDWRASPLRASSLAGVAPAFVLTAGYDPLCDEGDEYAKRLRESGVETQHLRMPGQIHGFLGAAGIVTEALETIETIGTYLRQRWSQGPFS